MILRTLKYVSCLADVLMYVCSHVWWVHMCADVCPRVWKPEVDSEHLP